MSASSPTTRTVPPATALAKGESCGAKKRRYGSSDVLANRRVSSESIWSVIAILPEPDTTSRGDAASSSTVSSSPRSDSRPVS